jgi:CRISP-associated protein Cas1
MGFDTGHLFCAWEQVRRGSHAAGIDGITPELFGGDVAHQIKHLHRQLGRETYQALPARGFYFAKKEGGVRLIGIPTVRDRIVQRSLLQGLYPLLEEAYAPCAHAYRLGRSIYTAVAQVQQRYAHQPLWVVKADIRQFFDQLRWPVLLTQLEALDLEPRTLSLIDQQLRSGVVVAHEWHSLGKGVLQGSSLSGALANLYLSDFDRQCHGVGINLVRYGDDCLALFDSWMQAHRALSMMESWLADLYLSFSVEKTRVFSPEDEFTFLGHRFCRGVIAPPAPKVASSVKAPGKARITVGRPKVCALPVGKSKQALGRKKTDFWKDGMSTLYISEQGAYLRVQHEQFRVFQRDELLCTVPVNRVSHVVLFGSCNVSHGAVSLALRRRIPILYLSQKGQYFGRLETSGQAQVKYLVQQVNCAQDPEFLITQSRSIIDAKVHNSRILLMRLQRRHKDVDVRSNIGELKDVMAKLPDCGSVDELRGYEGHGARVYFEALSQFFDGPFAFTKRNRRPPKDPINSLLSLGYTLLSQNMHSMVEAVGLHTHFGNLHVPRNHHPALVSDLVEEFRALVVDSFVAYLINSQIFKPDDFTAPDAKDGVYLHPAALKKFLKHWEQRLHTEITHPQTGHKITYRRCLELQVWEYVACLMGEKPAYQPMKWPK